ncbi:hypothetical protein [Kalamiella sp. sgz302252]|uniref:hypothetical protein n=1 Tax=Pantoea sp. sgz302252 TaxID=3341827 RepID=UPI0036D399E6
MFNIKSTRLFFYLILFGATVYFSWLLTNRYFPIEPDAANSPLVWRALLVEGFSVLKDWKPTPDNWYFTVYPINFIFFILTSSDGIAALTASTAFFVALTATVLACLVYFTVRSWHAVLALMCLLFLPAYLYTFGFVAHPFSHYSTNFFGAVCLGLSLINLKRNSSRLATVYSVISLLAAVSDPWFSATYFLPLLLVNGYFSWKKILSFKSTAIVFIAFILAMTHVVPKLMGLPVQRFKLVPIEQWPINAEWTVHILGRSLNLFFIDNSLTWTASIIIWVCLTIWALFICLRQNNKTKFITIFCILTISAIISSFIISYDTPGEISARFFVNAVCFAVVLVTLLSSYSKNVIPGFVLILYFASSLYSYHLHDKPLYDQKQQTYDYIAFLEQHNLTFGYADFWQMSNGVNWLSDGKIHITSVLFNDDFTIDFTSSRSQTMKSWLTEDFTRQAPKRQFISIPSIKSADLHSEGSLRVLAIETQFGKPDQVLIYGNMTILIYNHPILIK